MPVPSAPLLDEGAPPLHADLPRLASIVVSSMNRLLATRSAAYRSFSNLSPSTRPPI